MKITDEYIKEAEKLLLGGKTFDTVERLPFIKSLDTLDLLAVPGSGKTTALQAKLYCLAQDLPIEDGSGILVLSHTNAAVEEIKKKLKGTCPQLFIYPNFVGTIQSFIDTFLAFPFFVYKNNFRPRLIEYEEYYKRIEYKLKFVKGPVAYYKRKNIELFRKCFFRLDESGQIIVEYEGKQNENIFTKIPNKWIQEGQKDTNINKIINFIRDTKLEIFKDGYLNFADSYFYANKYIYDFPEVTRLLRERFKYVFIDETQDLEKYQLDLVDKIFNQGEYPSVIQRIGDINQSIYNSGKSVKVDTDWITRKEQLHLTGSNRLTPEIANVVNNFTLDRKENSEGTPKFKVVGLRILEKPIKPHVILFDNDSKSKLKNKFEELIKSFQLDKKEENKKYGFKIIGWSASWKDEKKAESKLRLEDIFKEYSKGAQVRKKYFATLSEYLQCFDREPDTLVSTKNTILDFLLQVLYLEGKTYNRTIRGVAREVRYSQLEFLRYLKEDEFRYENFKLKLFSWSFSLATLSDFRTVYNEIKAFLSSEFKIWFEIFSDFKAETKELLQDDFVGLVDANMKKKEKENPNEINIEIGTVHSVKGQTHCATMYVETTYHKYETEKLSVKIKKLKTYEFLPNPLINQQHSYRKNQDARAKETVKMMYVGFSRPTDLLCFAVMKNNLTDEQLIQMQENGWEKIDLTV